MPPDPLPERLPNCEAADVELSRLHDYLLAARHPFGRHKARFFARFGYWPANAERLRSDLLILACSGTVRETVGDQYGIRYVVEGDILTLSGHTIVLRTVWMIDGGGWRPRLITAYPA
jgi:hypothetical protein